MVELPEAKLQIIRALLDQAPDKAVQTLLRALSSDSELDHGLAKVKRLVEIEAEDRRVRNMVLAPIAALCAPPTAFSQISFPTRTLVQIWKGLKTTAPLEVELARTLVADWQPDDSSPEPFDTLCAMAAAALRACEQPNFLAAAAAADAGSGSAALASCLDMAAVTRRALARLPSWLGRMTDEKAASLRLAYKDVVDVADDGGPRFFEMMAHHLAEPWHILRVVSAAMGRPSDTYLAASELAGFGESILADIDRGLDVVSRFTRDSGRAGARAAAEAIHLITLQIAEVEQGVTLSPDSLWGRRLMKQRRALASAVEAHLRAVDDAVGHALPLQSVRVGPRTLKGVPRLTGEPDPKAIERAVTLLVFLHEIRNSASTGGFASARGKAMEILEARLDTYVEDLLDHLRHDDTDHDRARAYLNIAADLCGEARDEKAAQLVRRRAAAA